MNAVTTASTPVDEPHVHHDLDQGTQPADINAIGHTASRFPVSKVIFIAVVGAVVLGMLVWLGKMWLASVFTVPTRTPQQEPLTPSQSAQGVNRSRLPGSNTPLEGNSSTPGGSATSGQSPDKSAGNSSGNTPASPSVKADTPCPATALVDKRSGQAVKDAQGQPVMVDCKGVMLSAARIPAPAPLPAAAPTGYSGIPGPGTMPLGQTIPTPTDRYSGDTTLANKKPSLTPTAAASAMGAFPPPPVSSAELEARLKRLMNPTTPSGGNSAPNPILANPSANASGNPQGAMGGLLSPTSTPKAMAMRTFDPNLTIPKGDAINCAMTTRVVTEISGFTSCIVSENVYSANGKVLLVERMSEIQGEYTAVGQPGQRRVYVLWSRVRKPGGITIDIASPSTDSLGAAGIDGIVDNRWFERIGSAYMLSIFKDFLAANAASTAGGTAGAGTATGSALYQNSISTSTSLAEKVLSQSMNIKPVVYAHQGERIAIYVARDLDFSGIYQVTPVQRTP